MTRVAVDDWSPVRHRRGMTTRQLDLTGLKCPLPALKTRKALSGIGPGERLEVRCTDPLAAIDIPNLINEMGDRLQATERDGDHIIFLIEKAEAATV
jgi:tRNA 2-thiouridine synthesizing protein A